MWNFTTLGVEADVALNLNLDTGVIAIVIGVSATLIVIFLIGTYLCARGCLKKPQKPVMSDKRKIPTRHYDTYPGPFMYVENQVIISSIKSTIDFNYNININYIIPLRS